MNNQEKVIVGAVVIGVVTSIIAAWIYDKYFRK